MSDDPTTEFRSARDAFVAAIHHYTTQHTAPQRAPLAQAFGAYAEQLALLVGPKPVAAVRARLDDFLKASDSLLNALLVRSQQPDSADPAVNRPITIAVERSVAAASAVFEAMEIDLDQVSREADTNDNSR